ncbi:hypothetical protein AEA01_01080 [Xanthomonas campestris pv. campestris]|nr:hypothetical protein AEA01_01080 [Xanthomonas campestris pv. campestris]
MLINTIPILEAQASSEIENIVTTTDELFRYADHQGKAQKPATKEALRYRSALYEKRCCATNWPTGNASSMKTPTSIH